MWRCEHSGASKQNWEPAQSAVSVMKKTTTESSHSHGRYLMGSVGTHTHPTRPRMTTATGQCSGPIVTTGEGRLSVTRVYQADDGLTLLGGEHVSDTSWTAGFHEIREHLVKC